MVAPDRYRWSPRTLQFEDRDVEQAYCRAIAQRTVPAVRAILVAGLTITATFDWVDQVLAPDAITELRWVRFGVMVPVMVVAFLLTLREEHWRYVQVVACVTMVVVQAGVLAALLLMPDPIASFDQLAMSSADGKFLFFLAAVAFTSQTTMYIGLIRFVPSAILVGFGLALGWIGEALLMPSPVTKVFGLLVFVLAFGTALTGNHQLCATRRGEFANAGRLALEREKSEKLLRNMLPEAVVARLKAGESQPVDRVAEATVLFADIEGFTQLSEQLEPSELVDTLNQVFSAFDALAKMHGVEKIKTIGDAYMAAAGVPEPASDHVERVVRLALDMRRALAALASDGAPLRMRIGVHTGPVVAGVIGVQKFAYDLWGDTVNTASRMESHGAPDRVHVGQAVYEALRQTYDFEPRGALQIKGKGTMQTYFVIGPKPSA